MGEPLKRPPLFSLTKTDSDHFRNNFSEPEYSIFLLKEKGCFSIDFVKYEVPKYSILFLSPYQNFNWLKEASIPLTLLQFHGDFYCIEYHKKEVACNGLLFNNIYLEPFISLDKHSFQELEGLMEKMDQEALLDSFSISVLKAYLQLILALCSKEKVIQLNKELVERPLKNEILEFQELLESHFIEVRSPLFYAERMNLSPSSFSRKVKQQFGKTPTQLIRERVILEAKKLLHLTYKSVKEIAAALHFIDEFYFSRYFKKEVGLSPTHYREKVGISIAAK